jgi:hypothetical protein
MEERQPPTWEEIRSLIEKVDQVCRESEYLRAHAERVMKRPMVFPDRRHEPRKHRLEPGRSPEREEDSTWQGNRGQ